MNTNTQVIKQKKTCRRVVIMEPAFLDIIRAQSTALGCEGNRHSSISDYARRCMKAVALLHCPQLRNILEVNWDECKDII